MVWIKKKRQSIYNTQNPLYRYQTSHKILTRSSSGNRLRGLWLQIFIIYSCRSGFSNELGTSLKIVHNFLIVHELIKATFEDLYIFSFNYLLRQAIPDVNDSMRESILPYIKTSPFLENLENNNRWPYWIHANKKAIVQAERKGNQASIVEGIVNNTNQQKSHKQNIKSRKFQTR